MARVIQVQLDLRREDNLPEPEFILIEFKTWH